MAGTLYIDLSLLLIFSCLLYSSWDQSVPIFSSNNRGNPATQFLLVHVTSDTTLFLHGYVLGPTFQHTPLGTASEIASLAVPSFVGVVVGLI